ncbi:hypothetical protein B4U80_13353 [Leptotrombidium deliense]|uniref:CUB domain-containing protein n=1 Tax=Leptotrombidium deliense TaxID=299467 RepID=A0A443S7M9_9ACAR|nr:hypothetical protein B4U80_13353 [Leptotrombidium deliense]
MGFTTYESIGSTTEIKNSTIKKIWPTVECEGTEQKLSDCEWSQVMQVECNQIMTLECGQCSKRFENSDFGVIQSPGYPDSYFPLTQCDMFVVTSGDGIDLKFTTFNLPTGSSDSLYCSPKYAYIEIKPNGDENDIDKILSNTDRYCAFRKPEEFIRVMSKVVMIHFSGGIFTQRSRKSVIGVRIEYKTFKQDEFKPILIFGYILSALFGVSLILLFVFILYKSNKKHEFCGKRWTNLCTQNVDGEMYEEVGLVPPLPPRTLNILRVDESRVSDIVRNSTASTAVSLNILPPSTPVISKYTQLCASTGNCQYLRHHEIRTHSAARKLLSANNLNVTSAGLQVATPKFHEKLRNRGKQQKETPIGNENKARRNLFKYLKSISTSINSFSHCNISSDVTVKCEPLEHNSNALSSCCVVVKTPPRIYVIGANTYDTCSIPKSV